MNGLRRLGEIIISTPILRDIFAIESFYKTHWRCRSWDFENLTPVLNKPGDETKRNGVLQWNLDFWPKYDFLEALK